ncbi:aromatic-L-amino-acid decarboxylase [Phaeosphaeriaceae sp. PMI808]|nr:aromatic-L-amino-acid decarboxylase [Phaeosphaeriaceae sp. PMI808]
MDSSQFRAAGKSVIDEIANYYDSLEERSVAHRVLPGYLRPQLPDSAPEEGESWDKIQADIDRLIIPGLLHWQSPRFMGFFPCNSSFPAMLGDMYSGAFNAAAFNWVCSPAVTELETIMMDWLAKLLALPQCYQSSSLRGGGLIQGTASEVVLTAVIAARERRIRNDLFKMPEGEEKRDKAAEMRGKMVVLASEHAHSSTQKAAIIAGTRFRTVPAPKESNYSVTGDALKKAMEECIEKGLIPFYFTATLGSTATCAVDDLPGILKVTYEHPSVWIHVDAAYAGSALICPEYQHLCKPMLAFDSFNVNLHKWLPVNFDCSAFFVKDRNDLIDTFSLTPSYLRNDYSDAGLVTDYRDWQIPLGRRFRSLKVWFVLRTYGVNGLRAFIRKHIKLGEFFRDLLQSRSDYFRIVTGPAFGLVTFQVLSGKPEIDDAPGDFVAPLVPDDELPASREGFYVNQITNHVYEQIMNGAEFFLTSTVVGSTIIIRVVSATVLSEEKYLSELFDALVKAVPVAREKIAERNINETWGI